MKIFSRILGLIVFVVAVQSAVAQGIGADSVRLGSSAGGSTWLLLPSSATANYRLLLPPSLGLLPNQLMYANGTTGQMSLLTPGNNNELLRISSGNLTWINQDTLLALTGWSLLGNTGINASTQFLGTTDGQPLRLVTNGTERLRILSTGKVGIGTSVPTELLHMVGGNLLLDTVSAGTASQLRLKNPAGTFYTAFKSGAQLANISYTLPTAAPSSGQFLTSDGSSNLSWVSLASLGSGTVNNSTLRYNLATSQWMENTNVLATSTGALTLGGNSAAGSVAISDGQATSKTATISAANLAANRAYTIPDAGAAASFVMTEGAQTLNGVKTFGSAPVVSPFSSAGLVKNNASGVLSSGQATLTTDVTGVLPIANGGTNSSTALNNNRMMVSSGGSIVESAALTNGQLLVGSTGAAPTAATLTAGSGISITNGAGSITISNTSASVGAGTVNNSMMRYNLGTSQWVEDTNARVTTAGAMTLGSNSNAASIALNDGQATSKTATIAVANQAANRIYTIPDAGTAANFVMTEGAQTLNGVKTFGSAPVVSPFSSAGLVKNNASGVLSSGQAALTTDVTGVLPIANGGTNSSTALNNNRMMVSSGGSIVEAAALTNGQLLVGSTGAAPTAATLTAGSGISITNGAGSITISNSSASVGAGTVNNSMMRYNLGTSQWVEDTNARVTTAGAMTLGSNSNAASIALNDGQATSKTATIAVANQAANRIYTIPDAGTAANFVMTEGAQTLNGVKTFGSAPVVSPFSSAGLVKNNASGVLSSGQATLTTDVTGVLPIANGGTNSSTALNNNRMMVSSGGSIVEAAALTNGQLLVGSTGAAPTAATLTAGSGISISNAAGSITISNSSASVGAGTVNNSMMRYNLGTSQWVEDTNARVTTAGAMTLGSNSNAASIALNDGQATSKTATIAVANQAANRIYTIPDAGTAANFVMTEGAQTLNGVKTFGSAPVVSPFSSAGLVKNNASGVLSSGQATLTTDVTGILPVANGGTGVATMTGFPSGNGTAAMTARTLTGTSNQIAVTNGDGVSGNPTFSLSSDAIFPGSGANTIASGATGSRPGVPTNGMMRYNSTTNLFEFYQNGSWTNFMSTGASIPISSLTAAAASNSINNADYAQTWQWNSLSSNSALSLSSSSTAAASNTQTLLNLSLSGANATTTQTTYGMQVANTHTGTSSTNIGGYFSASGGTNNYGLIVAAGNAGIGTTSPGSTLDVKGTLRLSGSTSGYVGFAPAAAAGSTTYTLPSADGSSGQVLSTNGSGTLAWTSSSINTPISGLTAATATNSINNAAFAQTWQWNTLAGSSALTMSSSSTAAASNAQTLLNLSLSGANATTTQTTYGMQVANTHTGTSSTNVGATFSASGGTNNYGLLVPSGSVGIGTSTPTSVLHVNGASRFSGGNMVLDTSASGTAGQLQMYNPARTFYTALKAGANAANVTYTLPTADGSSGQALLTNGSGTLSWGTPVGTTPISSLTLAGATNSINNADYAQTWQWNSLSSNSALSLTSSSTAAAANTQTLLNLSLSGANATTTQTTYGMQVANTHTGTSSTNIGGYFSASGGTNNYGLIVAAGNTGIGTTSPGSTLDVKGTLRLSGSTSGYVGFAPAAAAGSTTYTLPSADGSNGQALLTNGSGTLSWGSPSATTPISSLTAAAATNSINNAAYAQTWQWNTLAGASALTMSSSSTAAASNAQTLLNLSLSGANATTTQTTYGMQVANTHTGTSSTNVGGYFSASGGTNNYGLIVAAGNAGIGTTSPGSALDVKGTLRLSGSTSGYVGFAPAAAAGSTTYTLPSADGSSGQALVTNGSGTLSWSNPTSTTPISSLTAAAATNSINNAAYAQTWQWNTLAGASALTMSSTSTAAASNAQTLLNLSLSGANATTTQTTYGMQVSNTHTGTSSTNIGGYFSASGGSNNYGLIVNAGSVGIGTSTPGQKLETMNGNILLNNNNNTAAELRFAEPSTSGSSYTAFKAGAQSSSITYTLPTSDGSANAVLSTNGSGTLSWTTVGQTIFAHKTADEQIASSTALQDDADLSLSIGANEIWEVDCMLRVTGSAGDFKFAFTLPASATMWISARGDADDSNDEYVEMTTSGTAYTLKGSNFGVSDSGTLIQLKGLVTNSSTAGTVQLRWAQNSSNATATTVKAPSYLRATRVQ